MRPLTFSVAKVATLVVIATGTWPGVGWYPFVRAGPAVMSGAAARVRIPVPLPDGTTIKTDAVPGPVAVDLA